MLKNLAMCVGAVLMAWGLIWSLFIPNFAYMALGGMVIMLAIAFNEQTKGE